MSASGHKQSFTPILPECLHLGVKRTSITGIAGKKKAGPINGTGSVFLVAGARLSNYMQIEVEPFPLVG
jgi:hypothetical protein